MWKSNECKGKTHETEMEDIDPPRMETHIGGVIFHSQKGALEE